MSQRKSVLRPWRWRVRELAQEQGLSLNELARRAGVSRSTVQAFCRDPQHSTTIGMWARLAQALGVSLAQMYERVPESEDRTRDHE
jgi:transcriptional regulator with XRE-family HTH domain